jgi:hypothetical protein
VNDEEVNEKKRNSCPIQEGPTTDWPAGWVVHMAGLRSVYHIIETTLTLPGFEPQFLFCLAHSLEMVVLIKLRVRYQERYHMKVIKLMMSNIIVVVGC